MSHQHRFTLAQIWREGRLDELRAMPHFDTVIMPAMYAWQSTPTRFDATMAALTSATTAAPTVPHDPRDAVNMDIWNTLLHLAALHTHMVRIPAGIQVWHAAPAPPHGSSVRHPLAVSATRDGAQYFITSSGHGHGWQVYELVIGVDVFGIPIDADPDFSNEIEILIREGVRFSPRADGRFHVRGVRSV